MNELPNKDVFDQETLLDAIGGDRDLLKSIVEMFLDDLPVQVEILEKALREDDLVTVKQQAHKIKGAAANIRAEGIRRIFADVETALKENNRDLAAQVLDGYPDRLENFRKVSSGRVLS